MNPKILIIGYVWPEPNSSAAGSRMMQFIEFFLEQKWEVVFATPALDSEYRFPLESIGVSIQPIKLNDDSFDGYVKELQPTFVLFDRFMMEEQFGWRVVKNCPDAIRILETSDLHSLRKSRHEALKKGKEFEEINLNSDVAKREIASIYRCDLSIIISTYEMELLEGYFKVPKELLIYVPLLSDSISEAEIEATPTYEERANFITIGNFLHEPNWDCVQYLKKEIWPVLRKKVPTAEMHIYGAYPQQKALQLNNPKEKFYIKGRAEDAQEVVKKARVCLAPLRFGAGMKGKLLEAMLCGTPSITSNIGAESMQNNLPWNGMIVNEAHEIIVAAEKLYKHKQVWLEAQNNGVNLVNANFSKKEFSKKIISRVLEIQQNIESHRHDNFTGAMLAHHFMKSTEFMSRWIQEKNKE